MKKSIKLAFLGLILASVAAPAVCTSQKETTSANKKQHSFFSKVVSDKYAKVAAGATLATGGSAISLAMTYSKIPRFLIKSYWTLAVKKPKWKHWYLFIREATTPLCSLKGICALAGTYCSVRGGLHIATS